MSAFPQLLGAKRTWSIYEYSLGKRRCRRLVLLDPVLLHHNIADVRAQIPEELLLMQRLAARVPERHLDDLAHARWPGGDDDDPGGEIDRLLDRMGDEHHRLSLRRQHVEQEILHIGAGLRVECAERLVHEQKF